MLGIVDWVGRQGMYRVCTDLKYGFKSQKTNPSKRQLLLVTKDGSN